MIALFINGWDSSPAFFHDLVRSIDALNLRCILVDFKFDTRDAGTTFVKMSPVARAVTIKELLDELAIDRLGIVAFGMFGGAIARQLVQKLGIDRFKFITMLAPGPCLIDNTLRDAFWNLLPLETRSGILDMKREDLHALAQKAVDLFHDGFTPRLTRDEMLTDLLGMVDELHVISDIQASKQRHAFGIPVEMICGELDEVVPLELSFKTMRGFGEVQVNIIPMAGHFFPLDYPEETANCIRDFLVEKVDGISSAKVWAV